ncbi:hypothetical protein JCM10213v2_004586 [Rhodosporidiobolus nylandii]
MPHYSPNTFGRHYDAHPHASDTQNKAASQALLPKAVPPSNRPARLPRMGTDDAEPSPAREGSATSFGTHYFTARLTRMSGMGKDAKFRLKVPTFIKTGYEFYIADKVWMKEHCGKDITATGGELLFEFIRLSKHQHDILSIAFRAARANLIRLAMHVKNEHTISERDSDGELVTTTKANGVPWMPTVELTARISSTDRGDQVWQQLEGGSFGMRKMLVKAQAIEWTFLDEVDTKTCNLPAEFVQQLDPRSQVYWAERKTDPSIIVIVASSTNAMLLYDQVWAASALGLKFTSGHSPDVKMAFFAESRISEMQGSLLANLGLESCVLRCNDKGTWKVGEYRRKGEEDLDEEVHPEVWPSNKVASLVADYPA